jgi:hypothetical protein
VWNNDDDEVMNTIITIVGGSQTSTASFEKLEPDL